MIDGYLLRYFLGVVEAGSFTAAALRANVTQPTLSAGIAKLEKELGALLFVRSARRIELTAAGTRFLTHARNMVHEYNLALGDIGGEGRQRALRIGIMHTVPAQRTAAIVTAWLSIEGINGLELLEGSDSELLTRLDQGRIDMALTLLRPAQERFQPVPLGEEAYLLGLSPAHPLAGNTVIAPEALRNEPMIVRRRCEVLSAVSRHFTSHGVRPPLAYRTMQEERALAMVAAGLGVTVLPESYACAGIICAKLGGFSMTRTLGVLTNPQSMALRSEVDRMTAILQSVYARTKP